MTFKISDGRRKISRWHRRRRRVSPIDRKRDFSVRKVRPCNTFLLLYFILAAVQVFSHRSDEVNVKKINKIGPQGLWKFCIHVTAASIRPRDLHCFLRPSARRRSSRRRGFPISAQQCSVAGYFVCHCRPVPGLPLCCPMQIVGCVIIITVITIIVIIDIKILYYCFRDDCYNNV